MPQCLVSFGSNLGTRESLIVTAARQLAAMREIENFRTSRLFETPPIGGPSGQSSFLNGVAVFETTARAREVLLWLQAIEQQLGRQRHERWAARCIDLDVVLHGSLVGGANDLTVPHPRYTARRFVLRPACDVAPEYRDPRFGWTIKRLADHLDAGNASLALAGGDEQFRIKLCECLQMEHGIRTFAAAPMPEPMTVIGTAPVARRMAGIDAKLTEPAQTEINVCDDAPWVSAFVPPLPNTDSVVADSKSIPRLIARIQWTKSEDRWPAPHQIWPSSSAWPEYRLEVEDFAWAASELASALASMRCPLFPISDDHDWWR